MSNPITTEPRIVDVEIPVDGVQLAGHLRVPASASGVAIVLTGPFTGVKEQVAGDYAQLLSERGFVTLAFDHRGFGASGGEPRQHEDPSTKLADLVAATSWLAAHDSVDAGRIGCVGICMGGGYALKHTAFDPRVRALAVVAGAFNDPRVMRANIGAAGYRDMMRVFAEVAADELATGVTDYIKAVSNVEGEDAAMPGDEPFAYYGTDRSAADGWVNQMTRSSIKELLTVDLAVGADFVGPTPTLVVHGETDGFCSPDAARDVFERIDGPKEIMWLATENHIDLYDNPVFVVPAVERIAEWMHTHL